MEKSTEPCATGHVWSDAPPSRYITCLRCSRALTLSELLDAYLAQHPEDEQEPR